MPKFRLVRGHHIVGDKLIEPGMVFSTDQDMLQLNSFNSTKFERLYEEAGVTQSQQTSQVVTPPTIQNTSQQEGQKKQDDGLEKMTVAELRSFAEEAGIDLLGVNKKEDIIVTIRANV